MDCCSTEKNEHKEDAKNTANAESTEHGGCCSGKGMWLHLGLMLVLFAIIWFFGRS